MTRTHAANEGDCAFWSVAIGKEGSIKTRIHWVALGTLCHPLILKLRLSCLSRRAIFVIDLSEAV